jgi:hypothetical protein
MLAGLTALAATALPVAGMIAAGYAATRAARPERRH